MRRALALLSAFCLFAPALSAETPLPERRAIVTEGVDYYGGDLQPLFDTTLEACDRQCRADPACVAFTFNTRSRACFPKATPGQAQAYDGAVSARIETTPPVQQDAAAARRDELGHLLPEDMVQARALAQVMGLRYRNGQWPVADLTAAVRRDEGAGNLRDAMFWAGAAVAQGDGADLWADFARLAAARAAQLDPGSQDARDLSETALGAAINAYLRVDAAGLRAEALLTQATALERLDRGRAALSALRLAQEVQPRPDIAARLEDAIGKYGFRITGTTVDSDLAAPRLCAEFSEPLRRAGADFAPFVRVPDPTLAVEATENRLCITGVSHGTSYTLTFRAGLPADSGEALARDVPVTLYVRDRAPAVRFPGRAYVLPRAADAGIPVETVNLARIELSLRRVDDRSVLRAIQDGLFGAPLDRWEMDRFNADLSEAVWSGTGEVENRLNADMTTRLPVGDVLGDLAPGLYALSASVPGDTGDAAPATQWFVLSDIGLTMLQGSDGLTVVARRLHDAAALPGTELSLLARSNRVLATAQADDQGVVRFGAGLLRGAGGSAPALVMARTEGDFSFLSLTDPAFDLSDRGVAGRDPAGPMDLFLATDRGAYRAGEVVHVTALLRDGAARALPGVPLTAILTRPDGVEYSRTVSARDDAGGHVLALPIAPSAPRGPWRLAVFADPQAPALASTTLLVEDFLPERIDVGLSLPDAALLPGTSVPLGIEARYLFGAPGADLPVEGTLTLRGRDTLEAYPGYRFGRHDGPVQAETTGLGGSLRTDAQGLAQLPLALTVPDTADRPFEATAVIRVAEGSGRPVERSITRALAPAAPVLGLRPRFDGTLPEGTEAEFDLIAIGPDLAPAPMQVGWTLNRITTRYQWYQLYGNWNWEPVTRRETVAQGNAVLDGNGPVTIAAPVGWGQYELLAERTDGPYAAASVGFDAGWYAPADAAGTPDRLEVSLDKPGYRPGETARLRVVARQAGTALISVLSHRVVSLQAIDLPEGDSRIDLPVTDDWGTGVYVTASLLRPLDTPGRAPARALGLAHAAVDPGSARLSVALDAPAQATPRAPLDVALRVEAPSDTPVWVTLAAVDQGILNLTGFQPPAPSQHYFGQRRLGVDLRDLYGRLVDGNNGAMGRLRSGGDAGAQMRLQGPPPTEDLVSFFSGPVAVQDGVARVRLDIPAFNGSLRLMAIAWSSDGVGEATSTVLVRDPVVLAASLPRHLAPGDTARLRLEFTHAEGAAGDMPLAVSAQGLDLGPVPGNVTLPNGGRAVLEIPITASQAGDAALTVALTLPDGRVLGKRLVLGVRANDPEVARTRRLTLAPGESLTLDDALLADFRPAQGQVLVSAGALARFDVPGLLALLDRYPYGCTEQVTSAAMPLLALAPVAQALGLGGADAAAAKIDAAIAQVLTRQAASGGFGLWAAEPGDFWLDAYVTDFLTRARAAGHGVPDQALRSALDNLRNRIAYAADFDSGGEDIAYALYVLAREGQAAMGDLRYYADQKTEALATPLAQAQLGAALAAYGDQSRADSLFARAGLRLAAATGRPEAPVWRADYGSAQRDAAAVLYLAVQAGSRAIDAQLLGQRVATATGPLSTQEQVWTLLAASALARDPALSGLQVDGAPLKGGFVQRRQGGMAPTVLTNTGAAPLDLTLTALGVPRQPEPAGGYGYAIAREYFALDGTPVQPPFRQGQRFVTVLTVRPSETTGARLMVNDPLPAGIEIDVPSLLRSGDLRALDWLDPAPAAHAEFRADRFLAAVDHSGAEPFRLAYIARAVSPGAFHQPAASVEDMYRPAYRAQTETGRITVTQ